MPSSDTSLLKAGLSERNYGSMTENSNSQPEQEGNTHAAATDSPVSPEHAPDPEDKTEVDHHRRFYQASLSLENKGSVARDHLANERTFLAWLRTSLSLASIGVAITQLFRISSGAFTIDDPPSSSSSALPTATSSTTASIAQESVGPAIASLSAELAAQRQTLYSLTTIQTNEKRGYNDLGKPIGGTFIALGIVVMLLGFGRFFVVQESLARGKFVPARRSVLSSAILIGALIIAAFAAILAIHR